MIRTLDAEDLQAIEQLRDLIADIDSDKDLAVPTALLKIETVRKHLRSKYYDRPQELKS